ncbi:M20/M25/M40 family metallo-hydrolase [Arthrobacter sp. A2-55]|uniref:M20/M25/M40 family metallo-hydrolase n=1 Tax=Arthrobacter sp. A2-55 TaxID=2897337 RepID=UPI0021CD64B1|nr:M20/M25/M40 family metallo-hydrolase [Arthrobacter sp. A2-55]MCU6480946.1 M20/M25/M40 family metallo-hydrolase [Arthrobacter sp. A2-55]
MEAGSSRTLNRAVAAALAVGAAGTAAVMGVRAHRAGSSAVPEGPRPSQEAIGAEFAQPAADRLSELIRFRTVFSRSRDEIDLDEFTGLINALERLYPQVHAHLERELVNGHALLFTWPGTGNNAGTGAGPVVLMAHYDVVSVDERDNWTHPGFSGVQDGGYVWGRGALDDKGALVAILGAVESLLQDDFTPSHDIYLSFGNNEETAGDSAVAAAALLYDRGVAPWMVLDEGGAVAQDAFPGLKPPAAVVGVAEKGILDVELVTRSAGGHASTPPKMGATARLARAIVALESKPFPQAMPEPIVEMLRRIGAHSGLGLRLVTSNMWAFKAPMTKLFDKLGDETRAMTRTTVTITELEGSRGANVLASTARANANIRIAVGENVQGTLERLGRIINDPSVELRVRGGHEPSPVSASDNEQFSLITRSVAAAYPQAVVTPYVQTGATDSRNFTAICPAVYRFSPLWMDVDDRASLHAVNEKVRISSLGAGVVFYRELVKSLG